jgi:diguanylate cyclase (GGDEF)-like protein
MKNFVILLYCVSLFVQTGAVILCLSAFRFLGKFRVAWFILATGFFLMIGRRVTSLVDVYSSDRYHSTDVVLSLLISIFLLVGIYSIRNVFRELENKNNELIKLNRFDFLTQALSRAEIFKQIEAEIERVERSRQPLSILELDIDHFKRVNDRYGHQVGDEILLSLTQCCQSKLRLNDQFGRIGGEEFLILLPDTDAGQAFEAAERIRNYVAETPHCTQQGVTIHITISIGISTLKHELSGHGGRAELLPQLLNRADEAMYHAKKMGRNQSVIWSEALHLENIVDSGVPEQ